MEIEKVLDNILGYCDGYSFTLDSCDGCLQCGPIFSICCDSYDFSFRLSLCAECLRLLSEEVKKGTENE